MVRPRLFLRVFFIVGMLSAAAEAGQAIRYQELTLQASTTQTASGNTAAQDLITSTWAALPDPLERAPDWLRVQLQVTAASGTSPTLNVVIEDSLDGTNWNTVGTFAQKTAASLEVINIALRGDAQPAGFAWPLNMRRVRVRWTIGGTSPSFTFNVVAVAN